MHGWSLLITEIDVAFPREPSQARRLALPPVPLNPRLANLYHTTALPAGGQRVSQSEGDFGAVQKSLADQTNNQTKGRGHSLIADEDLAVLRLAENLEAFPQHVLGHAGRQVVDVKHLAVVLETAKPWQQSGQRTTRRQATCTGCCRCRS